MKEIKWSLWLLILRSENRNVTFWSTQSGDILLSQLQTYWFNELLFFFNIIINLLLENRKQKIYYNWNVYWEARSDMPYTLTKGYATNYRLNNRISCRSMDTFFSKVFRATLRRFAFYCVGIICIAPFPNLISIEEGPYRRKHFNLLPCSNQNSA